MNQKVALIFVGIFAAVTLLVAAQPRVSGGAPLRPVPLPLYELEEFGPSTIGDPDGDGLIELLVMASEKFLIYAAATGEFEREILLPDAVSGIWGDFPAIGQLDADPAGEIVIAARDTIYALDGVSGEAQWIRTDEAPQGTLDLYVGAIDDQPGDEIVTLKSDGVVRIRDGLTGASRWSAIATEASYSQSGQLSIGDANGDGAPDIAVSLDSEWSVYAGPTFALAHRSAEWQYGLAAIVNRDGLGAGEILVARQATIEDERRFTIEVFNGVTFQPIETALNEPFYYDVRGARIMNRLTAADIDADGVKEYALAGHFSYYDPATETTNTTPFILIDDWDGPYPFPEQEWLSPNPPRNEVTGLLIADIDGDPPREIALTTFAGIQVLDVAAEPIPYFTSRSPVTLSDWPQPRLFTDDFSDPASGWPVVTNEFVQTSYADSAYHLRVIPGRTIAGFLAPVPFPFLDYELEVDTKWVSGSQMAYGVIIDWVDWDNYTFVLTLADELSVGVFGYVDGEFVNYRDISIVAGPPLEWNRLTVRRAGDEFVVRLNGYHDVPVWPLPANGQPVRVGLIAVSLGDGGGEFDFDNFRLQEIWRDGLPPVDRATRITALPYDTRPPEQLFGE